MSASRKLRKTGKQATQGMRCTRCIHFSRSARRCAKNSGVYWALTLSEVRKYLQTESKGKCTFEIFSAPGPHVSTPQICTSPCQSKTSNIVQLRRQRRNTVEIFLKLSKTTQSEITKNPIRAQKNAAWHTVNHDCPLPLAFVTPARADRQTSGTAAGLSMHHHLLVA